MTTGAVPTAPRTSSGLPSELEQLLLRFRRSELANRLRPARRRVLFDLTIRVLALLAGYTLMMGPTTSAALVGAVMLAASSVSLAGSWFHEVVHRNVNLGRLANAAILRLGSGPLGLSSMWWYQKHVRLHHPHVGRPDADPDIQLGALARVTEDSAWRATHRTQHLHMWFAYPLTTLAMLAPKDVRVCNKLNQQMLKVHRPDTRRYLLDKYTPFLITWMPLVLLQGITRWLACFTLFSITSGTLAALIVQVQHNTDLPSLDQLGSAQGRLSSQLIGSSDVGVVRGLWWWLSGGTSFHVVHHLIPQLTFLETPAATQRLRSELASLGVDLPTHSNMRSAVRSHFRLLRHLARRPLERQGAISSGFSSVLMPPESIGPPS